MPGGVDMHAHIAGPKVNFARLRRASFEPFPVRIFSSPISGAVLSTPQCIVYVLPVASLIAHVTECAYSSSLVTALCPEPIRKKAAKSDISRPPSIVK